MEHFYEKIIGWFSWQKFYKDMVAKLPDGSKVVEVGTYEGRSFAYFMVEMVNAGKKFEVSGVDSFTFIGENGKNILENFNAHLDPVAGLYDVIIGQSWEAQRFFEDQSLDFVFLDADHVYESIKKDLIAWIPKVKPGGIIAGHDWCEEHPGIEQAVSEIFKKEVICLDRLDEVIWYVKM